MLAVLLFILKIIGILLLSVLGFLLLAVLMILFVPVRYRLVVKRTGLAGDPPADVKVSVTWLLHILNIHANYPAEVYLRVRLFIVTLIKMPDLKREQRKKNKEPKKESGKEPESEPEAAVTSEAEGAGEAEQPGGQEEPEKTEEPEKKNILHTIRAFYDKIREMIRQIRDKIVHIRETVQSLKDNVTHYREIMESKAFQESLGLALHQLSGVLKSIAPKKCRIFVEEGMEDPATTASILAVYGMFYPLLYDKVTVVGNFEEQIIRADVLIKGKITAARILWAGIKIYFNKHVRSLIRMMKKEDKS